MPYLAEIAALSTALCWLCSSMAFAFAGRAVGASAVNQFRLYAALPLLCGLGMLVYGSCWPTQASSAQLILLAISGLVGLTIGDLALFHGLATIGPRITSVIMSLWPACTVGINALRGRPTGSVELLGIALTLAGVTLVLLRSREGSWRTDLTRRQWLFGMVCAFLGALGQAGGYVIASDAIQATAEQPELPALLATIVRMVAATLGMQLLAMSRRESMAMKAVVRHRKAHLAAWIGATFGPVLGVWLSMVAGSVRESLGVTSALMATTPIFMLPVAVWVYKARVGPLGIVGTALAVAGVIVCLVS